MIPCDKCPEAQGCCGIMIFNIKLIEKHFNKIEPNSLKIIQENDILSYIYEDNRCPFLDRTTRLCKIYEDRPKICRDYGFIEKLPCPYFKRSGNKRSPESQRKIER